SLQHALIAERHEQLRQAGQLRSVLRDAASEGLFSTCGTAGEPFIAADQPVANGLQAEPPGRALVTRPPDARKPRECVAAVPAERVEAVAAAMKARLQQARMKARGDAGMTHPVRPRVGEQGTPQALLDRIEPLPRQRQQILASW